MLGALAALGLAAGFLTAQQEVPAPADPGVRGIARFEFGASRAEWTALEAQLRTPDAAQRGAIERRLIAVLQDPQATHGAIKLACQTLARAGSARCVDALEGMLLEADTSHLARYALEALACPEAGEALRRALTPARGRLEVGIINSLGARRDAAAVPQLTALLHDPDAEVRVAALAALGRVGTADAAAALASAPAPEGLEAEWADAYLSCTYGLLSGGNARDAAGICRKLLERGDGSTIRTAALIGAVRAEGTEAAPLVLEALQGADARLRLTAARLVVELPGEAATAVFAGELLALPPQAKVVLLGALAERGDAAAGEAVARLAASDEAAVRDAALEALGAVGTADSVQLLAEAAAGGSEAARESLARLQADGVDEAMTALVPRAAEDVARALVRGLAERGCAEAVPTLIEQAESGPAGVRREALRALGRLADVGELPRLVQLLVAARSAEDRSAASAAVVSVCRRVEDAERHTGPLLAALPTANVDAQCSLLRVLGRLGGERALQTVRRELAAPEPELRDAALRALCDWPDDAPAATLLELARTAPSDVHRVLALRGYVRAVGLTGDRPSAQTMRLLRRAMEAAQRPEEQRIVLSALAGVADPGALAFAGEFLDDPQVGTEAHAAVLQIALAVSGAHEEEARIALHVLNGVGPTQQLRDDAAAGLLALDRREDWISGWLIAGPYSREESGPRVLFGAPFPPEQAEAPGVNWRLVPGLTDRSQPWLVDIERVFPRQDSVAYLRTRVRSPRRQEAVLELGSDDGIKAWLNGRLVHENNALRPLTRGEDSADVTLRAGWNTLLLKVTQGGGQWAACARFCARDGTPLPDLRVSPWQPAAGQEAP